MRYRLIIDNPDFGKIVGDPEEIGDVDDVRKLIHSSSLAWLAFTTGGVELTIYRDQLYKSIIGIEILEKADDK